MGSMYSAVLFIGITNSTAVQPVVAVERSVSYRERAAGMYAALPFAFAQVTIEFPYVFAQSIIYSGIFYSMASFEWDVIKCGWYLFFMYFTLLYFTFFGMMIISVSPNHNVAAILGAPFFMLWNLFSGFMIPWMVTSSYLPSFFNFLSSTATLKLYFQRVNAENSRLVEMVLLGKPRGLEPVRTFDIPIRGFG